MFPVVRQFFLMGIFRVIKKLPMETPVNIPGIQVRQLLSFYIKIIMISWSGITIHP